LVRCTASASASPHAFSSNPNPNSYHSNPHHVNREHSQSALEYNSNKTENNNNNVSLVHPYFGIPTVKTKMMRLNLSDHDQSSRSRYVKLNVGGKFFMTTVDTLRNHDSMFSSMVSGRLEVVTDESDWILIDRDGTHFEHILNFLRDGTIDLNYFSQERDLKRLLAEANYYSIAPLVHILVQAIDKVVEGRDKECRTFSPQEVKWVPFICTKQMDDMTSISDTGKAAVKFVCNRHNNKYAYTTQSDENLLKNIELFDKLAVLYQGRFNFFKDIFGFSSNEICQWTFYSKSGQKRAEVCCSSIVYATERKNIKIEFPEAKVQEELIFLIADEGYPGPIHNEVIRAMRCKHNISGMN